MPAAVSMGVRRVLQAHLTALQSRVLMASLVALLAMGFALGAVLGGWQLYAAASGVLVAVFVLARCEAALWMLLIALLAFSVEMPVPAMGAELVIPTEVLIPLLLVAAIIGLLARGEFTWTPSRLNAPVLLFVLCMWVTVAVSREPWVTFKALLRDSSYFLAGYLLIRRHLTSRARLRAFLFTCALATTLLTLYGFYTQFVEGVAIYQDIAQPFFKNHCIYAAFLAVNFAMLAAFILAYPRSRLRLLGLAVLGSWGFAIAMTFVRGAWLSLLALAVFYAYLGRRQINLKLAIMLGMLVVVGVGTVGWLQLAPLFAERMEHLTDLSYVTNYDRIDRWMAAVSIFREHPLLGVGWGRYADEYFQYIYYLDTYSAEIRMGAHNLYLEILAESGLMGAGAFALVILFFALEARKLRRECPDLFLRTVLTGVLGAMLTYLVHAFVNNLGPSDKIGLYFWVLLGLVPVAGRLCESQNSESCAS